MALRKPVLTKLWDQSLSLQGRSSSHPFLCLCATYRTWTLNPIGALKHHTRKYLQFFCSPQRLFGTLVEIPHLTSHDAPLHLVLSQGLACAKIHYLSSLEWALGDWSSSCKIAMSLAIVWTVRDLVLPTKYYLVLRCSWLWGTLVWKFPRALYDSKHYKILHCFISSRVSRELSGRWHFSQIKSCRSYLITSVAVSILWLLLYQKQCVLL